MSMGSKLRVYTTNERTGSVSYHDENGRRGPKTFWIYTFSPFLLLLYFLYWTMPRILASLSIIMKHTKARISKSFQEVLDWWITFEHWQRRRQRCKFFKIIDHRPWIERACQYIDQQRWLTNPELDSEHSLSPSTRRNIHSTQQQKANHSHSIHMQPGQINKKEHTHAGRQGKQCSSSSWSSASAPRQRVYRTTSSSAAATACSILRDLYPNQYIHTHTKMHATEPTSS